MKLGKNLHYRRTYSTQNCTKLYHEKKLWKLGKVKSREKKEFKAALHKIARQIIRFAESACALAAELASVADGALERLIGEYTREAGVRQLEREIQGVLRKAARQVVEDGRAAVKVTAKTLEEFAGSPRS